MHYDRKKFTGSTATLTSMKKYFLCLGFFMLTPGIAFSTTNQIPVSTTQKTNTYSFHETSELAETIWLDLTSRFIDHYENGDYQNALFIAQRAYNIANKNFGENDVNTADALLKLGIVNQTLGSLKNAEDHFLKALTVLEGQLSPDHPDVAVIMTNLGNIYFELNQPERSEKYHQQALRIRRNAFGKDDPSVAQSIYNLAVLYENQHRYDLAVILYRQAINSWSESLGPRHPYVGNALTNLGNVYNIQGNHKKAIDILQRTVAFKKSVFGEQHEEVAQTLINLGTNYLEHGEYNPASNAYKEALGIAQQILNSSDPQLALLMYTLANIYHTQARIEEQNSGVQASPEKNILPTTENGENNLTSNKASQKTTALFEQALPLYQRAVEILDDGESGSQSALDVVLTELAMLYKEIGNADMAQATELRIATH